MPNCSEEEENSTFHLFLYNMLISKCLKLCVAHYFIKKIRNKRELQQIVLSQSSDIEFKDFMKFYKDYTKESFLFLVNDAISSLGNPLRLRKNLL